MLLLELKLPKIEPPAAGAGFENIFDDCDGFENMFVVVGLSLFENISPGFDLTKSLNNSAGFFLVTDFWLYSPCLSSIFTVTAAEFEFEF